VNKVVALKNTHCALYRVNELRLIGDLIDEAERLYGSIRFWTLPRKRRRITALANAILEEAIARRTQYFLSLGRDVPPLVLQQPNRK
jgi:hypothetical protein